MDHDGGDGYLSVVGILYTMFFVEKHVIVNGEQKNVTWNHWTVLFPAYLWLFFAWYGIQGILDEIKHVGVLKFENDQFFTSTVDAIGM